MKCRTVWASGPVKVTIIILSKSGTHFNANFMFISAVKNHSVISLKKKLDARVANEQPECQTKPTQQQFSSKYSSIIKVNYY